MNQRLFFKFLSHLLNPITATFLFVLVYIILMHFSVWPSLLPTVGSVSSKLVMPEEALDTGGQNFSFEQIKWLSPNDDKVLRYLRRRHLTPPSPIGSNYALTKTSFTSPSDVRETLWDIFKDKNNGFFIECGANDGEFLSNTLDLELRQNWSGLLIEAHPVLGMKLKEKKRKAWFADVCLSPHDKITELEFMANPKYNGDEPHWKQGGGKVSVRGEGSSNSELTSFGKVECFPLQSLMAAIGVNHVDFFSLDVEGMESKILRALPYDDSLTIDFIIAETRCAPEEKASMVEFMKSKGYRVYLELKFDLIFERINKR